jgi:hypothetical protein
MAPGTSPSIDSSQNIAFQGSDGMLWLSGPNGGARPVGVAMAPNSSPSVTMTSGRAGNIVAYQGRSGTLQWIFPSVPSFFRDTGLRMAPGTSPSITDIGRGSISGVQMAFQGANGRLWLVTSRDDDPGVDFRLGMAPGTSPSIMRITVTNPEDSTEIAIQGNTGSLVLVTPAGPFNTGRAMMAGTSPSATDPHNAVGDHLTSGFAFQSNTGLLLMIIDGGTVSTGLGMQRNSSPAIATQTLTC